MSDYDPLPQRPRRREPAGDLPTRPPRRKEAAPPTQVNAPRFPAYTPPPVPRAWPLWLLGAGAAFVLLLFMGVVLLVWRLATTGDETHIITATPVTPVAVATGDGAALGLGLGQITFDANGSYAFPVAADPAQYVWTHYHWDGTHAVDIEARAGLSYGDFLQITSAQLVAVTHGVVYEWSGNVGGNGYILQGDDGLDYYYAHMASLWLADGTRVAPGTVLGVMGNTGNTAQFIEPHLHFALGARGTLQQDVPLEINGAEWLWSKFGVMWEERATYVVPPSQPGGWPVQHPQIAVVTLYDQALASGLLQPGIALGFSGPSVPDTPLDVVATLTGIVNVIRWTDEYGTRIQISNEATQVTLVVSGVDEALVRDGDLVAAGQVIGRWTPVLRPHLNLMLYLNGVLNDPTATLGP